MGNISMSVAAVIVVTGAIGWVFNIIILFNGGIDTGVMLVRFAGIFLAPLGAIMGYI